MTSATFALEVNLLSHDQHVTPLRLPLTRQPPPANAKSHARQQYSVDSSDSNASSVIGGGGGVQAVAVTHPPLSAVSEMLESAGELQVPQNPEE